jgi:hypothetical protein
VSPVSVASPLSVAPALVDPSALVADDPGLDVPSELVADDPGLDVACGPVLDVDASIVPEVVGPGPVVVAPGPVEPPSSVVVAPPPPQATTSRITVRDRTRGA